MPNPYIKHTSKTILEAGARSSKLDTTVAGASDWKRIAMLMQLNLEHRLKETRLRRGKGTHTPLKGLFGGGQ